jgi:(2R)-3-sulfolactate dehydrogenase (NADP+)
VGRANHQPSIPASREPGIARLVACGLTESSAGVVVDHLLGADAAGKTGHGMSRIPWLEGLLAVAIDPAAGPERVEQSDGFERWHGRGALGYLTLAAICEAVVAEPPPRARVVVAEACFPTGVLGAWARQLADAGLVAVVTATSPRRLPHPDGGLPLTGTNPIAIAVPSTDGRPFVADVSMGAVTHGDVLTGRAAPDELVPFGGPSAHKAFALAAGVELLVGALAGPEPGALVLVANPEHDPVPAFRALAEGLRLPGDRR